MAQSITVTRQLRSVVWLFICVAVLIVIVIAVYTLAPHRQTLKVSFLDIGQGDAIFIQAPNKYQLLIDGGPSAQVLGELGRVMPWFDRTIDAVIATHPDKDHIGGLIDVFELFSIGTLIDNGFEAEDDLEEAYIQTAKEYGIQRTKAVRGMRILLDDAHGVYLDILYPDQQFTGSRNGNNASVVTRLVYGEVSMLLTGDLEIQGEQRLVQDDSVIQSTILKLGHHGSRTSSSMQFLNKVHPDLAIIQAGKENSYGHPHTQVIERLDDLGISYLCTCEQGTLTFKTDGKTIVSKVLHKTRIKDLLQ